MESITGTLECSRGFLKSGSQKQISCQSRQSTNAAIFFETLKAKNVIRNLFDALECDESMNAILISGTGTGKTVGIAIHAAVMNRKILISLPKVIQVNLLVTFLKDILPHCKVGYAAGKEKVYDLFGSYDIIIVTYGHLLRKIISMYSRNQHAWFSDYIIVFDEVHESMGDIQAVLALAPRIANQKIITSATMDIARVTECMAQANYTPFTLDSSGMHPVEIDYRPVPCAVSGDRKALLEHTFSIVRDYLCDHRGRVLIFVPGLAYMDWIVDVLVKEHVVAEDEVGCAHADLWEDEILASVSKRVIVGTNVLESSVTIEGLGLVVDLMLKNELVNNNTLREVHISQAEAKQRAGRVGRTCPGTVVRVLSKADFAGLPEFPTPPFDLNDPIDIFLLMSRAFDHREEVGQILRLPQEQAQRCRHELVRVAALNEGGVTQFGNKVLDISLSFNFACPVARAFNDPACDFETRMLVLVVCVAFDNWPSYLFDLPRPLRLAEAEDKVAYVRDECSDLLGFTTLHTVTVLVLEAAAVPANCAADMQARVGSVRRWFARRRLNSKFGAKVLRDLAVLADRLFRPCGLPCPALHDFHPLRLLTARLRPGRSAADTQETIEAAFDAVLRVMLVYFPLRNVSCPGSDLPGSELKFEHFHVGSDGIVVSRAYASFIEQVHAGPSGPPPPIYAAALLHQYRQRLNRPPVLQLTAIVKAPRGPLYRTARSRETGAEAALAAAELAAIAAHSQAARASLLADGIVPDIVALARDPGSAPADRARRRHATAALANLSKENGSAAAMVDAGAVAVLAGTLRGADQARPGARGPSNSELISALTALSNLAAHGGAAAGLALNAVDAVSAAEAASVGRPDKVKDAALDLIRRLRRPGPAASGGSEPRRLPSSESSLYAYQTSNTDSESDSDSPSSESRPLQSSANPRSPPACSSDKDEGQKRSSSLLSAASFAPTAPLSGQRGGPMLRGREAGRGSATARGPMPGARPGDRIGFAAGRGAAGRAAPPPEDRLHRPPVAPVTGAVLGGDHRGSSIVSFSQRSRAASAGTAAATIAYQEQQGAKLSGASAEAAAAAAAADWSCCFTDSDRASAAHAASNKVASANTAAPPTTDATGAARPSGRKARRRLDPSELFCTAVSSPPIAFDVLAHDAVQKRQPKSRSHQSESSRVSTQHANPLSCRGPLSAQAYRPAPAPASNWEAEEDPDFDFF